MRENINNYSEEENKIEGDKPLKAKIISENMTDFMPKFIEKIAEFLKLQNGT